MPEHVPSSAIREIIRSKLLDLHTMLPGVIVEFYPDDQSADVKVCLMIKRQVGQELVDEEITILKDVPIMYPKAKGYSLTMPVTKGDTCMLFFCERSIDNWLLEGGSVSPEDYRHHDFSDAVAYVGLWDRGASTINYNIQQPELRTELGTQKLWLDDDTVDGFVEMVDLNNDSRILLHSDGQVRVANDSVGTKLRILKTSELLLNNPKSSITLLPDGSIIIKNDISSNSISASGTIASNTPLSKLVLNVTGAKNFNNILARESISAQGTVAIKTLLSKFNMSPQGLTTLGNSVNNLSINNLKTKLGSAVSNLSISPQLTSLGTKLAGLKVTPSATILADLTGAVTPKLVMGIVDALTAIVDNLGIDIGSAIADELTAIQDALEVINGLPDDPVETPTSVFQEVSSILTENNVDPELADHDEVLEIASKLDENWTQELLDSMLVLLESLLLENDK